MVKNKKWSLEKILACVLIVGGLLGLFSATMLTLDKIQILEHPNSSLNCNINPIVACGPVINKPQAAAFGVPNPFLGLIGFSVIVTVGVAIIAGAKFKRWFWQGLEAGGLFGVGFITWLQFQTIYRIQALCPYCMVVWTVTIPIFVYTTAYNLEAGNIKLPAKLAGLSKFIQKHQLDIVVAWYLIIILVILNHFWYYWKTVI